MSLLKTAPREKTLQAVRRKDAAKTASGEKASATPEDSLHLGGASGYALEANGTQHVPYRDIDGHMYELRWDPVTGWQKEDLTLATGAPLAYDFVPNGYVLTSQGTQHVVYVEEDTRVDELWSDSTGWHWIDLTATTGAPYPNGSSFGYASQAQGTRYVVYVGYDQHVDQIWWDSAGWHWQDLTALTGGPNIGYGTLHGYMFEAQGTQHVVFVGLEDDHVHEFRGDATGWTWTDLTVASGAPIPGGNPRGYAFEAQGTLHVNYRGLDDGHVYELWWDETGWHWGDLTIATGVSILPYVVSDPHGYMFDSQGTQHVVYRGTDNHVYELWWGSTTGWSWGDLTVASGAPIAISDPYGYVFVAQDTQHVNYRGFDDHIYELWWNSTTGWGWSDLTAATSPPPLLDNVVSTTSWGAAGWANGWLAVPGVQNMDPGSAVTVLARSPDHLDLFIGGDDLQVYSTYWDIASGWAGGWFPLPGVVVASGSVVTAIARNPDHIDLFVTSGEISSTYWDVATGWLGNWFTVPGVSLTLPGSQVTALSRNPTHLDVFVAGQDGGVYWTWWDSLTSWAPLWRYLPRRLVREGTPVSAIALNPDRMDLFMTDMNGSICSINWGPSTNWLSDWFNVPGASAATPGTPVTAIARTPENIDLFVTGMDNFIYSTSWTETTGWSGTWILLAGTSVPAGSVVTAIARNPDHMDLFVVDTDGNVYSTYFDATSGWLGSWFVVPGGTGAYPGSPVTAIARDPNDLNLFVTG